MLSAEDRALVTQLQDRMIELLVEKREAEGRRDGLRAAQLQGEFERIRSRCERIRIAASRQT